MNGMNLDVEMADENDGQISPLPRVIPPAPITGDADTEDEEERSFSSNDSSYVDDDKEQCENKRATDENQIRDENVNATTIRAAPVDLPTKTRLKIRVEKLYVTAEWKWTEGGDDTCGICRMPFEACCVDCKCPGDECPLVLGHCKHPFHMHCIVKWTEAQNTPKPQCPLCRQEWKFAS